MNVILDIETDGFNPSKIHCIVAKDIDTNTVWNTKDTEASSIWGNEEDVEELSLN